MKITNLSPLFRAAKKGRLEIVSILLQHEADADSINGSEGSTPLIAATEHEEDRIVETLVKYNANVNFQKLRGLERGWTALMYASKLKNHWFRGQINLPKLLLEHGAAKMIDLEGDIDQKTLSLITDESCIVECSRWTALMIACRYGNGETVQLLIEHGANVNKQNDQGMSPLMFAVMADHTDTDDCYMTFGLLLDASAIGIPGMLLKCGAYIDLRTENGMTALMIASRNGNTEAVRCLLAYGAKVNAQSSNGWSALMYANESKHKEIAQILQNSGGKSYNMQPDSETKKWLDLVVACESGLISRVRYLLKQGINVNMTNKDDGWSLLTIVSQNGNTEVAKLVLEYGADVSFKDSNGWSALMFACRNGWIEIARLLLYYGADVNTQTSDGISVLMISRFTKLTKLLLDHGANMNLQNKDGATALMISIQNKDLDREDAVEMLLKYGADMDIQNCEGTSALMIALQKGDMYIAEKLIKCGARINIQNVKGISALMIATQYGRTKIVELLLECGADVNAQDSERKSAIMIAFQIGFVGPGMYIAEKLLEHGARVTNIERRLDLMTTVQKGYTRLTKLILESGADVNALETSDADLTLTVAVKNENVEIAKMILDYGVDVNIQDEKSWSALMFASQKGHTQMTKLLLEYGAYVNLQKTNNWTALMLMLAGANANFETASLLLKYGANINIQGSDGWSALMLACQSGYTEIAKLLVESGADVNTQNKVSGMSALMIASRDGNAKTVKLLLDHEADINLKDNDGWTALMLADKNQHTKICKLLAKYEAMSAGKFSPTISLIENLMTETIVEVTNSEQHFSWYECGLLLYVPENSLPEGIEHCFIHIKASITDNHHLPRDTHLVSAVYLFKCDPKCEFSKPLTLEMQHCARRESVHKLCFIRSRSRADASFQVIESDDHSQFESFFPRHTNYGFIELDKFCRLAIGQRGSDERDYCANVYRRSHKDDDKCHIIHFAILWDTDAHNKV